MMTNGFKQSSRIVIDATNDNDRYIKKIIGDRIKQGQKISEVYILENGTLRKLY